MGAGDDDRSAAAAQLTESAPLEVRWSVDADSAWNGFAHRVVAVPDLDGDGSPELALSVLAERAVEIRSGRDGALLSRFTGPESFGFELCVVPGGAQGAVALLVAAPMAESGGLVGGRVSLHALPGGERLWSRSGDAPGDRLGSSLALASDDGFVRVSSAGAARLIELATGTDVESDLPLLPWWRDALPIGDVDGDGRADFARSASPASGDTWTRVWSGQAAEASQAGALLHQFTGEGDDSFGWSVAPVGDLDGDGADDLIVGAPGDDHHALDAGAVHVLSGRSGQPLHVLRGSLAEEHLGATVGLLGDINADGRAEIFVTSYLHDNTGSLRTRLSVVTLPESRGTERAVTQDHAPSRL
ncbi:MAG: hypothetical protein DHS20C15_03560 [Planctomycetota bacterium]|nr:MAG: hypothetical protein DHS20C15_03560 [Planctomycetota bacterium]